VSRLSVRDLSVRLAGSHVLQDISFDVAATGVTALLGRNGAGKSTTLRAILGLLPASGNASGQVRLDGRDISGELTYRLVRDGIGYVPEDRGVFGALTVAENLRLAQRPGQPADYATVYSLFPELARRGRQLAGTLSGGQQQMVAIARVLLHPRTLLLIDEPTKGLAPKLVTEVAAALEQIATPILLVEQNLAVVRRLAGPAVVLAAGRVVHTGPAARLLADPDLTTALLGVGGHSDGVAA
jgi:branched-chain amino acid transport system ATP-binding protein